MWEPWHGEIGFRLPKESQPVGTLNEQAWSAIHLYVGCWCEYTPPNSDRDSRMHASCLSFGVLLLEAEGFRLKPGLQTTCTFSKRSFSTSRYAPVSTISKGGCRESVFSSWFHKVFGSNRSCSSGRAPQGGAAGSQNSRRAPYFLC